MKQRLQGLVAGLLIGIMVSTGVTFAKTGTASIEAVFRDIKLYVDGVKVDPRDASGNAVEPFIYNGTTYLPVRAVGEAMGKTVSWDGKTSTVYVGEKPGEVSYLTDKCEAYNSVACSFAKNGDSFSMGKKKYTNGFYLFNTGFACFNLNGEYESMTFDIGCLDNSGADGKVQIYVDDKLVEEIELKHNSLPKTVTVPLDYGLNLEVRKVTGGGYFGLANIVVE